MVAAASPVRRAYLAEQVFVELGSEILRGEYVAGAALPAERVLAARFGVSKLIVRQGVHRLVEAGLVESRQGGATRVCDVAEAGDLRVIELFYRLAPESGAAQELVRDVLEKQFTQGLSLVTVFARRARPDDRAALAALASKRPSTEAELASLEQRFWTAVAIGGQNRILRAEVRWWYGVLAARPEMPERAPIDARWTFYRELARRLGSRAASDDAIGFYLGALGPAIDALFTPTPARSLRTNKRKHR